MSALSARERSSHCLVGTCSQHSCSIRAAVSHAVSECKEVKFSGGGPGGGGGGGGGQLPPLPLC